MNPNKIAGVSEDPKLQQPLFPSSEEHKEHPAFWKRLLFGFWPCAILLTVCALVCVRLNIHWHATGTMGFNNMDGFEAVDGRFRAPSYLCLFRSLCAVFTTAIPVFCVKDAMDKRANGAITKDSCPFNGFEAFSFCTIWTWCGMSLYFLQVAVVTAWYQLSGSAPSPAYAAVLWVWFEVMYMMAWLVFFAVWLALIPAAHYCGHKESVTELLSPMVLYLHNANVLFMQVELMLSDWTMQPKHVIFCLYFGIAYIIFNWWVHYKVNFWIYFFLDYDTAGVPALLVLLLSIYVFFWFGVLSADLVK